MVSISMGKPVGGRIGLLTIHDTLNYGSTCQAFSLYKAVEDLGYDVELIDYKNEAIQRRERTYSLREARTAKELLIGIYQHRMLEEKKENIWRFLRENMSISPVAYDRSTIADSNSQYDTFLVGSDMVWGMDITGEDRTYFLDFAREEKGKIAFSSSIGKMWSEEYDSGLGKLLGRFDHISVRDRQAEEWLESRLGLSVQTSCDPTMLWDSAFWDRYATTEVVPQRRYVLVYFITPDGRNLKDGIEYAKRIDAEPIYLSFGRKRMGVKNVRPLSVGAWLGLIRGAEAVFSASFHGFLFSLNFQKNVFYYNWVNKSRMSSLAKELDIEHREGTSGNIAENRPVDYSIVGSLIERMRSQSRDVLEQYLLSTVGEV